MCSYILSYFNWGKLTMKAYVHKKGFTMTGKAWEIRYLLRELGSVHLTVSELLQFEAKRQSSCR
ncbi:Z-ring formation inhibitor MciZ [Bacillus sp. FJAT-18017]|uniref:Z-ring formation inhibitor MciZ n=1 Tax=Bacillus sp. FJAT-18017 TaxID=1705566 RepID=UPI0009E78663